MVKIYSLVFIGFLLFFIINARFKPASPPPQSGGTSTLIEVSSGYGFHALKNDWPRFTEHVSSSEQRWLATNYLLIFDGSGSMDNTECGNGQRKIDVAKGAVQSFIQAIPNDANVGLYVFDKQNASLRIPLGINNRTNLRNAVEGVNVGGATPLKNALASGYRALEQQAEKQLGYGEYNVVIVTDGDASQGEEPESMIQRIYQHSPVTIHTIGFCLGDKHALNAQGITHYQSANNPETLLAGLKEVLAESAQFDVASFN